MPGVGMLHCLQSVRSLLATAGHLCAAAVLSCIADQGLVMSPIRTCLGVVGLPMARMPIPVHMPCCTEFLHRQEKAMS